MVGTRRVLLAASLLSVVFSAARADEGMWTYDNFPTEKMRAAHGWAPDAAWLKHAQLSSVRLAAGCSASFVSPQGLVMTNHHCARACIADLSDAKHDHIANGFTAQTLADERRCPGMEANQLTAITDITAEIQRATAGKQGAAFRDAERSAKAAAEKACAAGDDVRCDVVTLYAGGVYNLYKYRRFQDVRLVFAPEESIAFFGGDPDNFTFPRFDLDTSFVRVYDHGKPLASPDYLPFARRGVREGDITMVSGNPGSTSRLATLAELQLARDVQLPLNIVLYSELRGVLHEFATKGREEARISTSLLFGIENSLKAFKGRQLALVQGTLMAEKAKSETAFRARLRADPTQAAVEGAYGEIASATAHAANIAARYTLLERLPARLSDILHQAILLNRFALEAGKADDQRLDEYRNSNLPAQRAAIAAPAPIYPTLERSVLTWWLTKIRENLGTTDADVIAIMGKRSPEEIATAILTGTKLTDARARAALLAAGPAAIAASQDPALVFARLLEGPARAVREDYETRVKAVLTRNAGAIARAHFALDGRASYPDATFSLRLSYGRVAGYQEGGKTIAPVTDFAGTYAHATGRDPFRLPPTWLAAQKSVDPATNMNFVTTNDIIGGNSGSPVIGRNGEAVGLIFDGNIQSLGGDFGYDGSVNRAVAVDVTAITQALSHIYHADRLVRELTP